MSSTQQSALRTEGITRHIWERCPLASWQELGNLAASLPMWRSIGTLLTSFFSKRAGGKKRCWMAKRYPRTTRPSWWFTWEPWEICYWEGQAYEGPRWSSHVSAFLQKELKNCTMEHLRTVVRETPALWERFAMRLPSGEDYLVDPDPFAGTPILANSDNICFDIHNNMKFFPRLCLWAIQKNLEPTMRTICIWTICRVLFQGAEGVGWEQSPSWWQFLQTSGDQHIITHLWGPKLC